MKELNKERIIWIDYAKAIAMFFVVIGHVDSGNYLTNWISIAYNCDKDFDEGVTLD